MLLKLKFYVAIEIIQPFFPFFFLFAGSEMKTITANILKKQWNFIGTFRRAHFHK